MPYQVIEEPVQTTAGELVVCKFVRHLKTIPGPMGDTLIALHRMPGGRLIVTIAEPYDAAPYQDPDSTPEDYPDIADKESR